MCHKRLSRFTIETLLEVCCELAKVDVSCDAPELSKLSKKYEYCLIDAFITECGNQLRSAVRINDEISFTIVCGAAPIFKKCELAEIPEQYTRRYVILTIDGRKWYIDPSIGNWHTKYYDIEEHTMYISTKKPKWVVMKGIITEGIL